MDRPYTVSLDLYRGAAYAPFARLSQKVLAPSVLDACSLAERDLNVALDDVEYAAAVDVRPVGVGLAAIAAALVLASFIGGDK
jgi:hypothetical protein